jgi:hypothetical protein
MSDLKRPLPTLDSHVKIAVYIYAILAKEGLLIPASHSADYLECIDWLISIAEGKLKIEAATPEGL